MVAAVVMKLAHALLGKCRKSAEDIRGACHPTTNLIPVVIAAWPKRLSQPVTQDAKGAYRGLDIMAAQ
jgi:hypothetical protein